ncbi:hypothetical protein [Streptomyces sp. NPDC001508]|uniref:hypothetical protein n=1 Tax=Streptomyces sp. NPDC001508 TaxID=3154656 RepID=UPI003321A01B
MSRTQSTAGRPRRLFVHRTVHRTAESVLPPQPQDPPIYRDLLRAWADRGRTLPGRDDPEWVRLAALPGAPGRISESPAP